MCNAKRVCVVLLATWREVLEGSSQKCCLVFSLSFGGGSKAISGAIRSPGTPSSHVILCVLLGGVKWLWVAFCSGDQRLPLFAIGLVIVLSLS